MLKIRSLALASLLIVPAIAQAISLDDIQLWTGSGTNRAALVIEWSVPQSLTNSSVPVPVTDKTLVWGYRFNGTATGTQMLQAILATDPKLYVASEFYPGFGTFVEGIGYNLNGNGVIGITDGTSTNFFPNGQTTPTVNVDAAQPLNAGDLYWSGLYGANWETWRETNELGGFAASPNRGTNAYWTTTDTSYFSSGFHGQWQLSGGLDDAPLVDGSWVGFSVAAGEYESDTNAVYNLHKHAPVSPDGTYVAYVCNTNDFAVQIISTNNVYLTSPYNVPTAVLGRPTLKFIDHFGTGAQKNKIDRSKIIEPPYWTDPQSNNVIIEINPGGQITVNMGRRIYDDPNNPYGVDLIVYGNSFYTASGFGSAVTDGTDMGVAKIPSGSASGIYGHTTVVSVSQDGTNWFDYPQVSVLYPDDSYRWDNTNHCWTEEEMNQTKPLNPAMSFPANSTVAYALDQFVGASGGTGYDLKQSGFPWIQYVRVSAITNSGVYTVIDAIGAVNPVVVGDALSITPSNIVSSLTNLVFQKPSDFSQNLISLNFDSVSDVAKVSTVSLSEFSSFAPVVGNVSSAYQLTLKPVSGTNTINYVADIGLRANDNYSGNGNDLRVYHWNCTNWISQPFYFNSTHNEVFIAGVTNFSAFVVSQIVPPQMSIQNLTNGFAFQFTPVANAANILERSPDLVTWTPISTNTPANAQPITLQDTNAPTDKAFYRVLLNIP
jgi:hypothetical protein